MSSSGSGEQGCPLFHVVHPAFPLLNTASPILQGSLKDSLGEAVVACDMPESCKFPFLNSTGSSRSSSSGSQLSS